MVTVAFWIDKNWDLNESVIELLPFSGDHSGKAFGKLIFKALRRRKIERKLSTCRKFLLQAILKFNRDSTGANTADNASSNGPLNRRLSKYLWKVSNFHIDPDNMQIGCGGHVVNISCQYAEFLNFSYISTELHHTRAIYFGLGCADNPDVDDYYDQARGFPMVYCPDEDPQVVEEMKIAEAELKAGAEDVEDADQDSSGEDSTGDEGEEDGEDDWADVDEIEDDDASSENQPEKQKRKRKVLSCVDKVCVH